MSENNNKEINYEEIYSGSMAFMPLSGITGLPIDKLNFMIAQITALLFAAFFRLWLHPSRTSPSTRHLAACTAGVSLAYFCFGKQVLFALVMLVVCYTVLMIAPPTIFHKVTMVASLTFLSALHLDRQFMQDGIYLLDITGPLMILVQRSTALAYNLHDGLTKTDDKLTSLQKQTVVRKIPSLLEYFSYMMSFQSLLAGPFVFYTDYQDFIHGTHYIKYNYKPIKPQPQQENNNVKVTEDSTQSTDQHEPDPTSNALAKFSAGVFCSILMVMLVPRFPVSYLTEPDCLASSFLYKVLYMVISTSLVRTMYYSAWLLADGICVMSGLGYNGRDDSGRHLWNRVSNVDIYMVEFGESFKTILDGWNPTTARWLRLTVYERLKQHATIATFAVSCIWHGFYPGYYLAFVGATLATMSGRVLRRSLRHRVLNLAIPSVKLLYDFAGWLICRVMLAYSAFPHVLLKLDLGLIVYKSVYFYLHILGVVVPLIAYVCLPPVAASRKHAQSKPEKLETEQTSKKEN